jgi:hypothetical protein
MGLEVIIWAAVFTETTVFHWVSARLLHRWWTIKHISSNRNQELWSTVLLLLTMLNIPESTCPVTEEANHASCLLLVAGGTHPKWHPHIHGSAERPERLVAQRSWIGRLGHPVSAWALKFEDDESCRRNKAFCWGGIRRQKSRRQLPGPYLVIIDILHPRCKSIHLMA